MSKQKGLIYSLTHTRLHTSDYTRDTCRVELRLDRKPTPVFEKFYMYQQTDTAAMGAI